MQYCTPFASPLDEAKDTTSVRASLIMDSSNKANGAKPKKLKKKNALIVCQDSNQFWTTQKQFWQWMREGKVVKVGDGPLTGRFVREDEEKMVVLANTVLNLACPNHLREVMSQRRFVRNR